MKKVIFTLLTSVTLCMGAYSQYCGNSGQAVCSPSGDLNKPGLSPPSDSLAPVVNTVNTPTTIQFKNFDTITFGGQVLTIQSLRIDSIGNLPSGLCWATNKANNTFANKEDGCIKVSGTPCGPTGQYKLFILVTANVGVTIQTNADAAGLKYYVRLKNPGDNDTPVDTTQTASNPFIAYGTNCPTGVDEINASFSQLNVVPNPFNNKAVVSFYSDKNGIMTERMTNMLGAVVYKNQLDVKIGENSSVINRNSLPAGVYFYSVSDGKNVATRRVVISE